jgi:hypothetical protein
LHRDLLPFLILRGELWKLVRDFLKFVKSFSALQPLRCTQRASCKSIAVARGMPQRDGVFRRIEPDLVSTWSRPRAIRA